MLIPPGQLPAPASPNNFADAWFSAEHYACQRSAALAAAWRDSALVVLKLLPGVKKAGDENGGRLDARKRCVLPADTTRASPCWHIALPAGPGALDSYRQLPAGTGRTRQMVSFAVCACERDDVFETWRVPGGA